MTIGEKIKKIRIFRNITQKELGVALGFSNSTADARIAQYESNYRVPKEDVINKIAEILDVAKETFADFTTGSASDFMEMFFWIEETSPNIIDLFPLQSESGDAPISGRYGSQSYVGARNPIGIVINYNLVNEFLAEWMLRRQELNNNTITKDEYFEWKIQWPYSCDSCGKHKPTKEWKK